MRRSTPKLSPTDRVAEFRANIEQASIIRRLASKFTDKQGDLWGPRRQNFSSRAYQAYSELLDPTCSEQGWYNFKISIVYLPFYMKKIISWSFYGLSMLKCDRSRRLLCLCRRPRRQQDNSRAHTAPERGISTIRWTWAGGLLIQVLLWGVNAWLMLKVFGFSKPNSKQQWVFHSLGPKANSGGSSVW